MKVQLVKGETKETWGHGDSCFEYYFRPLTVEEKQNVNSHIVWKEVKGSSTVDFSKTDPFELLRLSVTKIEKLYASDDSKIDTIEKLLSSTIDAGEIDGIAISMWVKIWMSMNLSSELKKKLLQDSIHEETI